MSIYVFIPSEYKRFVASSKANYKETRTLGEF